MQCRSDICACEKQELLLCCLVRSGWSMISTVLCDPSSSCETPATARPGSIIIFITDRKEHWSCDVEETSTWSSVSRNAGNPAFATVEITAKKINIRLNPLIQARRRALGTATTFPSHKPLSTSLPTGANEDTKPDDGEQTRSSRKPSDWMPAAALPVPLPTLPATIAGGWSSSDSRSPSASGEVHNTREKHASPPGD